jgi:hypothetical protein
MRLSPGQVFLASRLPATRIEEGFENKEKRT